MQEVDFCLSLDRVHTVWMKNWVGIYRGKEGKTECSLCGNEYENVSHVLWECSAYSITRASFMKKLQELLEDDYEDFESLENCGKIILCARQWALGE